MESGIGRGFCGGCYNVQAASDEVYELSPIVVTATRYEKKDVENAASTQVFTAEQIQKTGQTNLQQALAFLDGVVYDSMGSNGSAVSSMTSEISMRGVSGGTLVLMNGTPINWRGKYNLEDIPTGSVERVEVVRGGGSVLYGSQAKGGVINIITKKELPNEVSVGLGQYGQQNYLASVHAGDLSVAYTYSKMGDTGIISSTWPVPNYTAYEMGHHYLGNEKHDAVLSYRMTEHLDLLYNHDESNTKYIYTFLGGGKIPKDAAGKGRYDRNYERKKDFIQLNLSDWKGWSGHLYYNRNTLHGTGTDYYDAKGNLNTPAKAYWSRERNLSYGYDVQKVWQGEERTFLLGTSYEKNEFYDYEAAEKSRNVLSAFGSWEQHWKERHQLTLSGRYTWTTGAAENKNFNNFSGQVQYLYRLDKDESLYASVGQSFVLPTFSEMYKVSRSSGERKQHGDPSLRPEKGLHYELGWKKDTEKRQYRAALFLTRIKDQITFDVTNDDIYPKNANFKNHGLELSMTVKQTEDFTWHTGLTLQDPQSKSTSEKAGTKNYWDRQFGRVVVNAGMTYEKGKWSTALNANYLAERVLSPSAKHSFDVKPYLLTSLTVTYAPNEESDLTLTVNNILNRNDNISHSSSFYRTLPTYYLLTYRLRW